MTKLLIVAPSTAVRAILRDRIARSGLALDAVVEEADGRAALERLAFERDIDLVLCDERVGGPESAADARSRASTARPADLGLVRTIRARFPRERHRIVVVCSPGDATAALAARGAGADHAVARPFTSEEIRAELAPFCR
jgi:CheY-like chemotaxis protein